MMTKQAGKMRAVDLEAKWQSVARLLEGNANKADLGSSISVSGFVCGFPAKLEALHPSWPFGVAYFLETNLGVPNPGRNAFQLAIVPRAGKGITAFMMRLFLFEAAGIKVHDKELERHFVFSTLEREAADQFLRYPGIASILLKLHNYTRFNELRVNSGAGLCLSQPASFSALNLAVCKETFKLLGEMGQVLYDCF